MPPTWLTGNDFRLFSHPVRLTSVTVRFRGFSLIEVVVVMALIALALTLTGPRIGAGIGRLELEQAAQNVRTFVKLARVQAQRTDRGHYVVLDRRQDSITLLDPDMHPIRSAQLPSSVQIVLQSNADLESLFIAPSGIVRGEPVRLNGRSGQVEVVLQ
jgi:prepilin-type N-terminal cleavage/methylation domain-containing protein